MAEHRLLRRTRVRHALGSTRLRSTRIRAVLALGIVLTIGVSGTYAFWTDDVVIQGTTLRSGTLDINVNGGDPYPTTTLTTTAMVPGSSSAEIMNVNNVGTAPAKYTLTGGLSGADAAAYNTAGDNGLLLTITTGARAGTGSNATCGGASIYGPTRLTTTTTTSVLAKRPTIPLPALNGAEALCFQIKLADTAPTTLQGKTATATFTATGTSDIS